MELTEKNDILILNITDRIYQRMLSNFRRERDYKVNSLMEENITEWIKTKYPLIYDEWILYIKNRLFNFEKKGGRNKPRNIWEELGKY